MQPTKEAARARETWESRLLRGAIPPPERRGGEGPLHPWTQASFRLVRAQLKTLGGQCIGYHLAQRHFAFVGKRSGAGRAACWHSVRSRLLGVLSRPLGSPWLRIDVAVGSHCGATKEAASSSALMTRLWQ